MCSRIIERACAAKDTLHVDLPRYMKTCTVNTEIHEIHRRKTLGMTQLSEILTLAPTRTFSWHVASHRHPAAFFKGRVGTLRQSGPQSLKCLPSGYLQGPTASPTTWQTSSITWKTVSCDNTSLLFHKGNILNVSLCLSKPICEALLNLF